MARAQNRTLLHLEEGNCDTGCHTEELEDIMQSEVSRSQKTVRVDCTSPGHPGATFRELEVGWWVPGAGGGAMNWESLDGDSFSVAR